MTLNGTLIDADIIHQQPFISTTNGPLITPPINGAEVFRPI